MIARVEVRDCRMGRSDLWVTLPRGVKRLMQVPDEIRRSVVFLYCRSKGQTRPAGTAFFGSYPVPGYPGKSVLWLLTAQHVIAKVRIHSDDNRVLIRINTRDGKAAWQEVSVDDWYHEDGSSVDCAAMHWMPPDGMDPEVKSWDLSTVAATNEVIQTEALGLGDEAFMIGLFRSHLGRDRNEPIIRVGNICAMPEDPIRSKHFGDMRAILIEARSISGLSGSPVFVHMGYARWREGTTLTWHGVAENMPGPFFFLGVMHGHWEREDAEEDELITDAPGEKINTGIGVVVPADEIMQMLRPRLEEYANLARRQLDDENSPTMDVGSED